MGCVIAFFLFGPLVLRRYYSNLSGDMDELDRGEIDIVVRGIALKLAAIRAEQPVCKSKGKV